MNNPLKYFAELRDLALNETGNICWRKFFDRHSGGAERSRKLGTTLPITARTSGGG